MTLDLTISISDIINVIVFAFTAITAIISISISRKSLYTQMQQFEEQIKLQISQYKESKQMDLLKNQSEYLPILLLESISIEENNLTGHPAFTLRIRNRGKGDAHHLRYIYQHDLCVYTDEIDKDLFYTQTQPLPTIIKVDDTVEITISASKQLSPKRVFIDFTYEDTMHRKYKQSYAFYYNFPASSEVVRIENYDCKMLENIE